MDFNKQIADLVYGFKEQVGLIKKDIIGIDIGYSAAKMSMLKSKGKKGESFTLEQFVSIPFPEGTIHEGEIQKEDEVLQAISYGLKTLGVKEGCVCVGVGGPNVILRRLQLPGGTDQEIEDQSHWEIEQFVPFDIDDSTIAHQVVGENDGGGVDVIVAVAKNSLSEGIQQLFEQTSARVRIIDLNTLALMNVMEFVLEEKIKQKNQGWIFIDFGAQKTSFLIYKNGAIIFSKEISIGGVTVSDEIQRRMGVNYADAEDLKIFGDENGNLPEEILDLIDHNLEDLLQEMKKTYDFYTTSTSDSSVKGIYITGGSALLPGFVEGLEQLLALPVKLFNPFERIEYDEGQFNKQQIEHIAATGAIALGLGMRRLKK